MRERVIAQVHYRPFEGEHRVFVIEAAEAMAEESQNALLKTLEEPPPYAHLMLVTSEPEACWRRSAAAVRRSRSSRCRGPWSRSGSPASSTCPPEGIAALAGLADGDIDRARFLGSERGRRLREIVEECCQAARAGDVSGRPWTGLLSWRAEIGKDEGESVTAASAARAEQIGKGRDADRIKREGGRSRQARRAAGADNVDRRRPSP